MIKADAFVAAHGYHASIAIGLHHTKMGWLINRAGWRILAKSSNKSDAVIVLPAGMRGRVRRLDQRQWLSRGRVQVSDTSQETLARVLHAIGHAMPGQGLAALRFWGQTGERSGAWMAAADPVHLETRIDHLCVHAFPWNHIPRADLRQLFDHLQKTLGDAGRLAFARLGPFAYLRGEEHISTASVSPEVVDGRAPDDFMPSGEEAAGHDLLLSELQMALHDHEVNQRRAASGQRVVNSIWLWGGGTAPAPLVETMPPLFADDPLVRGYWCSQSGRLAPWSKDFEECLNAAPYGFVAVAPNEDGQAGPELMTSWLEMLRVMLKRGDLRRVTLLFRDGLGIDIEKRDAWRFWRRVSPLLQEAAADD